MRLLFVSPGTGNELQRVDCGIQVSPAVLGGYSILMLQEVDGS
jgi:hypothetical protein